MMSCTVKATTEAARAFGCSPIAWLAVLKIFSSSGVGFEHVGVEGWRRSGRHVRPRPPLWR